MITFLKRFLVTILILLVLVQFYPKDKPNISEAVSANEISIQYTVPDSVHAILKASCYDCHSNNTVYPWYSKIQPVAWWLNSHITDGKNELNFSEFTTYRIGKQYRKLKAINDEVKKGDMPLSSYTLIHRYAKLDDAQKLLIATWATAIEESIKIQYPMDSLISKKQRTL
ncbi:MAG: heme-binding domain-containing protein [Ferruginibacter sp.]